MLMMGGGVQEWGVFSKYGVMVAIDTIKDREIGWFWSGKNKGKRKLGVLEKERERMKRGSTTSEEDSDRDTWSFL